MRDRIKALSIGMLLAALVLGLSSPSVEADQPLDETILKRIAREQRIALDRLEMGALEPVVLPLTGITLYHAKVVDTETGEVFGVVVDRAGTPRDLEEARQVERAAHNARYRRLHPALHERLGTMADGDRLSVAIWLKAGELAPLSRPELEHVPAPALPGGAAAPPAGALREKGEQEIKEALAARVAALQAAQAGQRAAIRAAQQANEAHLARQVAALQAQLLADFAAQGFEPTYVSPLAPLIYVELPKSAVLALSQRSDVDTIYGPAEYHDAMDSAKPTQKADVVDGWGYEGDGVSVAILEDGRVAFNNPHLRAGTTRVLTGAIVTEHATAVAGIVASQHSTHQGIAQDATIYSANATDYAPVNLSAAIDWASTRAEVINNSWGGNEDNTDLHELDRHLDYVVDYLRRTVTVAAGNEDGPCRSGTGRVTSPARGYNVISVGNYADQDTLTWDDDAMDACSSWRDPSTLIQKPEVAAVGNSITSTTDSSK